MTFRTQCFNLAAIMLLCASCEAFFRSYVPALSSQQVPTAEALFEFSGGNRSFIAELEPPPHTTILNNVLDLRITVEMDRLMESGFSERTVRETIRRTARLEVNGQLVVPTFVVEHPPATVSRVIWDEDFYYQVWVEEGLYILTFSLETPNGETHSFTWAYRAV